MTGLRAEPHEGSAGHTSTIPASERRELSHLADTTRRPAATTAIHHARMTEYTDDYEMMAAISSRDTDGVHALYNRYSRAVFSVCVRVLHDRLEAEEVLLDVFMEIWQKPERYNPGRSKPATFILLLARSRAIDRRRQNDRRVPASTGELPEIVAPTDHAAGVDVTQAIHSLEQSQQEVIRLSFFGGRSHSEIANELGIPLGTVKTRIRSAIQRLRSQLRHDRM